MSPEIALIGAGPMAQAHAAVLQDLGVDPVVVGRGEESAAAFTEATGLETQTGGLDAWLERSEAPGQAIVATSISSLASTTTALIEAGTSRILVEKPAGVDRGQIAAVAAAAETAGADVRVAYNRRFYASVLRARELIAEDGGVSSFTFEFTELADRIGASHHPPEVLANWFLANSTHVVDLAFFLGGEPAELAGHAEGELAWHPPGSRFAGSGVTADGATFSYRADWDAPGRWGVEVMTRARRLILSPLEQLQVQSRNEFTIAEAALDDEPDQRFKPGVHAQARAFLEGEGAENLLTISEHLRAVETVYEPILQAQARRA